MCANIRCARINQNGGMWRRQRVQFARGKKKDEERECDCEWFTRNVCVGVGNFIGSAIDVVNHLRMRNFNLKFCYFPSTRLPGNCALKKKREIAGGEEIVPTPSEPKDSTVNKPVVVKSPWKSHAHAYCHSHRRPENGNRTEKNTTLGNMFKSQIFVWHK